MKNQEKNVSQMREKLERKTNELLHECDRLIDEVEKQEESRRKDESKLYYYLNGYYHQ